MSETTYESAHSTLVSLGVILLVTILIVELAGVNKELAGIGALLFVGALLIQGISHPGELNTISKYPAVPTS